jgi:hypothetical protein
MIIESPLIAELLRENTRDARQADLLRILKVRFVDVPEELAVRIRAIQDLDQLDALFAPAISCGDLDAFRAALTPAPPAPSNPS